MERPIDNKTYISLNKNKNEQDHFDVNLRLCGQVPFAFNMSVFSVPNIIVHAFNRTETVPYKRFGNVRKLHSVEVFMNTP